MLTIIVGVLAAGAGALTTASLKWGRSAFTSLMAHIRRDNRTLNGGRAWGLPAQITAGKKCSIRVLVACAPSRSLRRRPIDPDFAIPFVRESFPGLFPDEPAVSLPN